MRDGYSIGAVSNLTGLPPETIRTWERRYDLVSPSRSDGGQRVYTEQDIDRLRSIATLTQAGERVGDLAALSMQELRNRIRLHSEPTPGDERQGPIRVVVLHATMGPELRGATALGRLEVCAHGDNLDDLPELDTPPDAVLVDLHALGDAPVDRLDAILAHLGARTIVGTFHFLSRTRRQALDRHRVRRVRLPVPLSELRDLIVERVLTEAGAEPRATGEHTERMFTPTELQRLMEGRPDLVCECPNHVASLVLAVGEFERYSRGCASATPEDEALHRELADVAGRARAMLEQMLLKVCAHDGIDPHGDVVAGTG